MNHLSMYFILAKSLLSVINFPIKFPLFEVFRNKRIEAKKEYLFF